MLHESEASRRMKGRKDKWVLKIIYCSSIQLGRKKTSKCQGHIENLRKKEQERMNCLLNLLCMQELMNQGLSTSWCQLQFFSFFSVVEWVRSCLDQPFLNSIS